MEVLDIVLGQVENKTRNKELVRKIGARVKHLVSQSLIDDCGDVDMDVDQMLNVVSWIRDDVKGDLPSEPNFQLLKEMLRYQKRFYKQCADVDGSLLRLYSYLIEHSEEAYNMIFEELADMDSVEFTFEFDYATPLSMSVKKVQSFCEALEISIKSLCEMFVSRCAADCKGILPVLIFHQEVIGNEKKWNEKLNYWFACHKAYKLHYVRGLGKADVVRELDGSPISNLYNFNHKITGMSNATHKLDTFLAEANRLIASAGKGTFPY